MRKLSVFNFLTLNGFYKGPNEDISWHKHGGDESGFANEGLGTGNSLVFGRITYEMMKSFWPTPEAMKAMPEVAKGMNESEKIVFSNTLKTATWNNSKVVKGDIIEEMKKLKQQAGKNMTILGSGSLVAQFADKGLIDDYIFMIDPLAIGDGTPIFKGITHPLELKLVNTRTFKNGMIVLSYQPK